MTVRVVAPADGSGAVTIAWDNSALVVPAGTIVDIPPGGPLEAAYGTQNLSPLTGLPLVDDQDGSGNQATGNG